MFNRKNLAESRLAAGISAGAVSFSVTTGEGQYFPSSNFILGAYPAEYATPALAKKAGKHELMIVGSRTSDAFSSVTRGAFGTTAQDMSDSNKQYVVYVPVIAEELIGINETYADAGGDDDYVVSTGFSLTNVLMALMDGLTVALKVTTVSADGATFKIDDATAKAIKINSAGGLIASPANSLQASGVYWLKWSVSDDCWVLMNPSVPAKLSGNVLPVFNAATHPVGTEFLLVPESVADQAARLVTGTPLRYVYQVDTGITYKCTSEDGDEANDWTAVGSGKIELKYHSNGTQWTLLSRSDFVISNQQEYYVDPSIAASNPDKKIYKTVAEVLGSNRTIILAAGSYSEQVTLTNLSNIKIVGLGSTYFNGTTLVGGAIFSSTSSVAAFKVQGGYSNVTIENIGCINSSTGDCFQCVSFDTNIVRKIRLRNITTYQSNGASGGHNILIDELGGDIKDVIIENCNCYGGQHGIIIKAKDVTVRSFYCQDMYIYAIAAISDNKSAAGRKSRAQNVHFIDGKISYTRALNGSEEIDVYCVDFFSETNANGVLAAENIIFNNIEIIGAKLVIGSPNPSGFTYPKYATGRSQIDPENIKISNVNLIGSPSDGLVVYAGNDIAISNCTAKNNTGVGFNATPANAHSSRLTANGCHSSGNGDDTFTGWSTGNV
jgi:hypothetical protein